MTIIGLVLVHLNIECADLSWQFSTNDFFGCIPNRKDKILLYFKNGKPAYQQGQSYLLSVLRRRVIPGRAWSLTVSNRGLPEHLKGEIIANYSIDI